MENLFFYGTLRHLPLLEIVMGRTLASLALSQDQLPGFRVSSVAEGPFPMIEQDQTSTAQGILVQGLTDHDIARLDFYEGSFAYDLHAVTLNSGAQAKVYLPQPGQWTPQGAWSLTDWESGAGPANVIAAREVMGYFGIKGQDDVAAMFPVIRARAASQLRAQGSLHGADAYKGQIDILSRNRAYSRFYALDDIMLRHETFDGQMTPVLDRAVFMGADAAIVLPYDPVRDRVLVVEQIRLGPIGRGDKTQWQLEPIAGRVDPGETPQGAALREAMEEAGLSITALEPVAEAYPSPGTSSEFYYIYLGMADLPDNSTGVGGLAEEGENIRSRLLSFEDLMARVERLDVANLPMALCAYYLARHRDRLRSAKAGATSD